MHQETRVQNEVGILTPILQGWRANGIRGQIDAFVERGQENLSHGSESKQIDGMDSAKRQHDSLVEPRERWRRFRERDELEYG